MTPLTLETITPRHVFLLAKMTKNDYFGGEAKDLIRRAALGLCQLWEHGDGIIVTELVQRAKGKELFVCGIEGLGARIRSAYPELLAEAKRLGARWLGGEMGNPRFEKLFHAMNARQVGIRFSQEIDQ